MRLVVTVTIDVDDDWLCINVNPEIEYLEAAFAITEQKVLDLLTVKDFTPIFAAAYTGSTPV